MRDRAFLLRECFAAVLCAGLLTFAGAATQTVSAAPQKSPVLYSASSSSTRAIALESVTLRAEPFQLTSDGYFGVGDSRTRIALFGTDFEFLQGEGANALSADAQDGTGKIYPLTVEYVGTVPNFDGVYMVIVRLNDTMPANLGDVLMRLRLHGMASNRVRVAIGQIGGGPADDFPGVGTPAPATPPGAATPLTLAQYQAQYDSPSFPSDADIIRFLEQSSWGPKGDRSDFNQVRAMGINAYLNQQFNTPPAFGPPNSSNYPDLAFPVDDPNQGCPSSLGATAQAACVRDNYSVYPVQRTFFTNALTRPDQLRQRVAFALHQITVVSAISPLDRASWETMYLQVLDRGAFGNYRTLLQEITLNPEMGEYLDMRLSTRTNPNENFAREILQLFSIGVNELNLDGTVKVDAQGIPIPAYTQTHVNEFTRLFTGWNLAPATTPPALPPNTTNWRDPMVPRGGTNHDFNPKTLFNGVVTPQCSSSGTAPINANCAIADLAIGLDNIYNHANVAPFISKQLIQHLVTSNPSPAYVARVATVFNANRQNPVQMQEVVRAILLDPEARGDVKTDPGYGKLREPIQYITNILRGFNATSDGVIANRAQGGDLTLTIDQPLFQPPTVFSYYQPEYQVPGTGILGPAFGILSTSTTLRRANVSNQLIYSGIATGTNNPTGTQLSFTSLDAIADNPGAVADTLNALLLHGTMSTQFRNSIITAMNAIPGSDANFRRKRSQVAAYLITTSSQFDVQR